MGSSPHELKSFEIKELKRLSNIGPERKNYPWKPDVAESHSNPVWRPGGRRRVSTRRSNRKQCMLGDRAVAACHSDSGRVDVGHDR